MRCALLGRWLSAFQCRRTPKTLFAPWQTQWKGQLVELVLPVRILGPQDPWFCRSYWCAGHRAFCIQEMKKVLGWGFKVTTFKIQYAKRMCSQVLRQHVLGCHFVFFFLLGTVLVALCSLLLGCEARYYTNPMDPSLIPADAFCFPSQMFLLIVFLICHSAYFSCLRNNAQFWGGCWCEPSPCE